jgi:hypothetical protein
VEYFLGFCYLALTAAAIRLIRWADRRHRYTRAQELRRVPWRQRDEWCS